MRRIEEQSKSLNRIIDQLPEFKRDEIRKWWRSKIFGAISLRCYFTVTGVILGFVLTGCRP